MEGKGDQRMNETRNGDENRDTEEKKALRLRTKGE